MNKLEIEKYHDQKANCEGLCDIDHDRISSTNPNLMPCVTCPFCKQIVTAVLTKKTISCPECSVTVNR